MRRIVIISFACVLAVLSVRCKDNCVGQPSPLPPNPAHIRVINASPGAPAIEFLFDSTTIVHSATFNTYDAGSCCYRDCGALGNGRLIARLAGGSTIAASAPATIRGGAYYTVVLIGRLSSARLLVLNDTLDSPPLDSARVRVIHAIPDAMTMTASLAGRPLVHDLAFGAASSYVMVHQLLPPDTGGFVVTSGPGPNNLVVELPNKHVYLPGRYVLTAIVLGTMSPNGTDPLATVAVFQDNVPSAHGLGDVLLQSVFSGVRLFNGINRTERLDLLIWNAVTQNDPPPRWRSDFSAQTNVENIGNDSMSGYFLMGFSSLTTDGRGYYAFSHRISRTAWTGWLTDSTAIDPFLSDRRYTIAVFGDTIPYASIAIIDTTPAPSPGNAAIRLVNGVAESSNQISVAVVGGPALFSNVAYKQVTGGHALAAGVTTFEITPTTGTPVRVTATLQDGDTYTLFALGHTADGTFRGKVCEK